MAGLIGGVVGGILTGLLAGAPLQVSGPAAGLTVVVAELVHKFGWETVCLITACAGIVQLILGWLKIARGALVIAPAVVHGMLAGIGITIALAQMHVVLGGKPASSPLANLFALPAHFTTMNTLAALLGVLTFVILVVWKRITVPALKAVPGPLIAVVVGTVLSVVMNLNVVRIDLPEAFTFTTLKPPSEWSAFAVAVLTVALIASVESLLCAVATDKLHSGARCNLDKELGAQGAGNLVSGLLGGLPVTGVIVRSSANIMANATSRWSAVLHGVWILLSALFLGPWIETIPLAVLAGLLVHVGVSLVNMHHIRDLKVHNEIAIYVATVLGVLCIDLLAGVGIGLALSILLLLRRLSQTDILVEKGEGRWHARISGTLTFATVPKLGAALAKIPSGTTVDVDLAVDFVDHAAFEALHSWKANHEKSGGKVDIDETHENWYTSAAQGTPRQRRTLPQGIA
jgi:carbonic anhydrase